MIVSVSRERDILNRVISNVSYQSFVVGKFMS